MSTELQQGDQFYIEGEDVLRGLHFFVTQRKSDQAGNVTLECVDTLRDPWNLVVGDETVLITEQDSKVGVTVSTDAIIKE